MKYNNQGFSITFVSILVSKKQVTDLDDFQNHQAVFWLVAKTQADFPFRILHRLLSKKLKKKKNEKRTKKKRAKTTKQTRQFKKD